MEMVQHLRLSPALKKVRFNRRCYSLLLHAKIDPENLRFFYRTYRLPKDPFFPLYFAVKRDYLEQKNQRKQKKQAYIASRIRSLSPQVLEFIKFLALLEQNYHYENKYPVWSSCLFPKTKKLADEYHRYTYKKWSAFFSEYLPKLAGRYRDFSAKTADIVLACFHLNCLPDLPKPIKKRSTVPGGISPPPKALLQKSYRRLSKRYHPDSGGDQEIFLHIKAARDTLIG